MIISSKKSRVITLPSALFIILICFLFLQCSTNKTNEIIITEENGVTTVSNPEVPLYPEAELLYEEELSIGLEDGDSNYVFFRLSGVETDLEGNLYILESGSSKIKVFDPNGVFLYSFGKKGQGPGEFMAPFLRFKMSENENIYVSDFQSRRITRFTKKGERIDEFVFTEGFPRNFYVDKVGDLYISKSVITENPQDRKFNISKITMKGESLTDFGVYDGAQINIITSGNGRTSIMTGWEIGPVWIIDHDGNFYFGRSDSYEIRVVSAENKHFRTIQRSWRPVPVTDEEIAERKQRYTNSPKEIVDQIEFPKQKPSFARYIFDDKQNLWVRIFTAKSTEDRTFDVFNPEGKYIYQFKIPFSPTLFKNGKIYTIKSNEDGILMVKRYNYNLKER